MMIRRKNEEAAMPECWGKSDSRTTTCACIDDHNDDTPTFSSSSSSIAKTVSSPSTLSIDTSLSLTAPVTSEDDDHDDSDRSSDEGMSLSNAQPSPHLKREQTDDSDSDFLPVIPWRILLLPWSPQARSSPWILNNGSYGGHFDFVPRSLRVGPWSVVAVLYASALVFLTGYGITTVLLSVHSSNRLYQHQQQLGALNQWVMEWYDTVQHPVDVCDIPSSSCAARAVVSSSSIFSWNSVTADQYPTVGSVGWIYHTLAWIYMSYITHLVWHGPLGYRAWATYTVQSWTMLWIRHALCIAIPVVAAATTTTNTTVGAASWLVWTAEVIRAPVAVSQSITLVVWNGVLFPGIWLFLWRDDLPRRQHLLSVLTCFRMLNLHVGNSVFLVVHLYGYSPTRTLDGADLVVTGVSLVGYLLFYTLCLDRLGVHLYPVVSPRSGPLVLVAWTGLLVVAAGAFGVWRHFMMRVGE